MSVARGAVAGFVATVPMTLAMEGLRAVRPQEQRRKMPPKEIVENAAEKTGGDEHLSQRQIDMLAWLGHFGFGAASGAVFGSLFNGRSSRLSTSIVTGIAYGLAVWALAYGAGLPKAGLHPSAAHDTQDRNEVLIASHIVWGAVMGALSGKGTYDRGMS